MKIKWDGFVGVVDPSLYSVAHSAPMVKEFVCRSSEEEASSSLDDPEVIGSGSFLISIMCDAAQCQYVIAVSKYSSG